jgi:hypothetical protein
MLPSSGFVDRTEGFWLTFATLPSGMAYRASVPSAQVIGGVIAEATSVPIQKEETL